MPRKLRQDRIKHGTIHGRRLYHDRGRDRHVHLLQDKLSQRPMHKLALSRRHGVSGENRFLGQHEVIISPPVGTAWRATSDFGSRFRCTAQARGSLPCASRSVTLGAPARRASPKPTRRRPMLGASAQSWEAGCPMSNARESVDIAVQPTCTLRKHVRYLIPHAPNYYLEVAAHP